jgi:hypothetical protein
MESGMEKDRKGKKVKKKSGIVLFHPRAGGNFDS